MSTLASPPMISKIDMYIIDFLLFQATNCLK